MNHVYTFYDLILSVPFPCPMLTPAPAGASPDVEVVEGEVRKGSCNLILDAGDGGVAQEQVRPLLLGGRRVGRALQDLGRVLEVLVDRLVVAHAGRRYSDGLSGSEPVPGPTIVPGTGGIGWGR